MSAAPAERPSLVRKVTPRSEENRNAALDLGVKFTLGGETYEVRMGDVTPALGREIRKATGMSFRTLLQQMIAYSDVDLIAALIWIARRIQGEEIGIDDVAFGYEEFFNNQFVIVDQTPEEVEDSPEA